MAISGDVRERARLQRALYRRVRRQIWTSLERMSLTELMDVVETETSAETVARVLSTAPDAAPRDHGWAAAVLRGAAQKRQMLQIAGGTLTSGEVAQMLGLSLPGVKQRMRRGQLLAVPLGNGEWGFPVRQFNDAGGVREGLPEVLAAWAGVSPWVVLSVLVSDDPVTGEGIALDRIGDSSTRSALVALGRNHGEHIAA